jgi:putative transposase
MKIRNIHRPIHIFILNAQYFITLTTYKKKKLLNTDEKKDIVRESIMRAVKKYGINLNAWVILDNHFHLLISSIDQKIVPTFIKFINSRSSVLINKLENTRGVKNFYQYWDIIIRDEDDFFTKINYIHYNPVHHRYCKDPSEYKFSSCNEYLDKYGVEWLNDCVNNHPLNTHRY